MKWLGILIIAISLIVAFILCVIICRLVYSIGGKSNAIICGKVIAYIPNREETN